VQFSTCKFGESSLRCAGGRHVNASTSASTPTGSFPVSIVGSTAGGPSSSQNLSLVVNTATSADYTINISNSPQTAGVTGIATFDGTVSSVNGYSSSVTLSCGSGGPLTCTPGPGSVTPTPGGAAFTVSVSSDVVQNYNFNIVATGTDSGHTIHSFGVVFNSTFDFAINNNSAAEAVTAGRRRATTWTSDPWVTRVHSLGASCSPAWDCLR